ncbi:DUF3467 domain-containing protein [Salsipaludibacter albus]|uniref:DUF3467 domain-containing protein n=1 Tax=Salsipaludibacter albus TaxID=2849650 RepID=UPI001EE3E50C|nr:DUF3467 domain-containing protein [Salsipaludibacter albus]MBY5163948.1 DUF3467 domain-containing protein [Salsipaludibacter albus]
MADQPDQPEQPDEPEQPRGAPAGGAKIRVVVDDDLKHGKYANFSVIQHTAHEFTLDFCQMMPSGEPGQVNAEVVARIKLAPTMVAQVMRSLANAQSKYEDKFGSIRAVG